MSFSLNRIGQIALAVRDVDRAEAFYQQTLGLPRLFRFGDLTFFDCAGVRLLLEKAHVPTPPVAAPLYTSPATISRSRCANWNNVAWCSISY